MVKVMPDPSLPIIQSLWIGGRLSAMERLSIRSFLAKGHVYHLYAYGEVEGIPEGAVVRDGNEILASDRIFVYKKEKSHAGFANLFRYKLLLERGGFWVDTDVVCLKPYRFSEDLVFGRGKHEVFPGGKSWTYGNSVLGAKPGSGFISRCLEYADAQDPQSLEWGQTGPKLVTRLIRELGLEDNAQPQNVFNCITSNKWHQFIHPKASHSLALWCLIKTKGAYSLHFFNEMWRSHGKDKNQSYPGHTIYERLKRLYGVGKE